MNDRYAKADCLNRGVQRTTNRKCANREMSQRRGSPHSTVAILWPEQPLIPVISHKLAVSRTDPACLSAKANWFYFNNLQNDSSIGLFRIRRFSIFKPGFDSR